MDKPAGITVMLSLVGIIVISMLGTCVEAAGFSVSKTQAATVINTSTKALLTEYSRPLYDHYGLFFLESTGKPYERVIAEYAGDSLSSSPGHISFLTGELKSVEVTDRTLVGDDEALALQKEINEYMKREITSDALSSLLKKASKISDVEEQAEQLEETVEEQKEDTKLDERILRLMYLVDGVSVSKKGKVKVTKSFAKKFAVTDNPVGADFGVMQATVWNKMKPKINTVPKDFKKINSSFKKALNETIDATEEAIKEGDKLKSEYTSGSNSDMAARVIDGLGSLRSNLAVLKETKRLISESDMEEDELRDYLTELWKDYDTRSLSFDYTGVDSSGDGDNPLDEIGDAFGSGLLSLVLSDKDKVSKKNINEADKYASYYKENKSESEDLTGRVDDFANDEKVSFGGVFGSIGSYALEEFSLDSYITKVFTSYTQKEKKKKNNSDEETDKEQWKEALDYGWEYIVSGKKSDESNLESVLSRILLIRTVINTVAIMADSEKRAEAYAAAAALVGFTGLTFLIRLTQTLILIAWALVEALVDVSGILMGRDVPLVKKSSQVLTTFPEIFLITNKAITTRAKKFASEKSTSFGYKEYLLLFMAMTDKKIRRYRAMDLIEASMKKNGYKDFSLGECVFSMEVSADFRFPARFFRMSAVSGVINRDLTGYDCSCLIKAGYL